MSEIYLLKDPIVNELDFYNSFLRNTLKEDNFFTDTKVEVPDLDEFITYSGNANKNSSKILGDLIKIMLYNFIDLKQDIYMSQNFWMSYLVSKLRMSLFRNHPTISENFNTFRLIVLRKFDWENYLYKATIFANVLNDKLQDKDLLDDYIDVILNNMDLFNYILKLSSLRNDNLIYNMITLLYENKDSKLSSFLKYRSKDTIDVDASPARLVLLEFNTTYPAILFPMLNYDDFKAIFFKYLNHNEKIDLLKKQYEEKREN